MTLTAFLAIAVLHLMAAISPGPSVLMSARTGVVHGFRAAFGVAMGIGVGAVVWAMAALFGLALLFEYAPGLLFGFKVIGGLYLVFMAYKLWKNADQPLDTSGDVAPPTFGRAFTLGLITQLANPKPAILFAAIFLGTVPPDAGFWVVTAILAVVFFNDAGWNVLVGRLFSLPKTRRVYIGLKGWMDRVFGGLLAALGIKVAAT